MSKNFDFVTNFGRFKISTLMQEYVFEGIFPCLKEFFNLRLPMKADQKELVRRVLKLCMMCVNFKSKPIHEKIIMNFINDVRNNPILSDIANSLNMSSAILGASNGEQDDHQKVIRRNQFMSIAQKLKVFMQTCRTDEAKK